MRSSILDPTRSRRSVTVSTPQATRQIYCDYFFPTSLSGPTLPEPPSWSDPRAWIIRVSHIGSGSAARNACLCLRPIQTLRSSSCESHPRQDHSRSLLNLCQVSYTSPEAMRIIHTTNKHQCSLPRILS